MIDTKDTKDTKFIKYVYVIHWYDNAEPGTIFELVENPILSPKAQARVHVVKTDTKGTRWIGKDCSIIITKEETPEYFL